MQILAQTFDGVTGELIGELTVDAPNLGDSMAQATVDVAAYDAAVARAKTATTVAGLRAAVLDLAAAITPAGT